MLFQAVMKFCLDLLDQNFSYKGKGQIIWRPFGSGSLNSKRRVVTSAFPTVTSKRNRVSQVVVDI